MKHEDSPETCFPRRRESMLSPRRDGSNVGNCEEAFRLELRTSMVGTHGQCRCYSFQRSFQFSSNVGDATHNAAPRTLRL